MLTKSDPLVDLNLPQIVRRIVSAFDPERVVLFGSRAKGQSSTDSDLDLMVEMQSDLPRRERAAQVDRLLMPRAWSLDVLVYTPAEVAASAGDSYGIMHEIRRTGRVLYCRRPDMAVDGSESEAAGSQPSGLADPQRWLAKAESDLTTIDALLAFERTAPDSIAYHAEQAVEKALKAVLVSRAADVPRTHDPNHLLVLCLAAGVKVDATVAIACERLNGYSVDVRYPGDDADVSDADARHAATLAADAVVRINAYLRLG